MISFVDSRCFFPNSLSLFLTAMEAKGSFCGQEIILCTLDINSDLYGQTEAHSSTQIRPEAVSSGFLSTLLLHHIFKEVKMLEPEGSIKRIKIF